MSGHASGSDPTARSNGERAPSKVFHRSPVSLFRELKVEGELCDYCFNIVDSD